MYSAGSATPTTSASPDHTAKAMSTSHDSLPSHNHATNSYTSRRRRSSRSSSVNTPTPRSQPSRTMYSVNARNTKIIHTSASFTSDSFQLAGATPVRGSGPRKGTAGSSSGPAPGPPRTHRAPDPAEGG